MLKRAFAIMMVLAFATGCGGSDRKFTSLSGGGSISRINKDYENRHEAERKKRDEREKNARKASERGTRADDSSQFPDQRTEDAPQK
jgi:hypothetical protein